MKKKAEKGFFRGKICRKTGDSGGGIVFFFLGPEYTKSGFICALKRGLEIGAPLFGSENGCGCARKKERHTDRVYRGYEKLRFVIKFGKNADEPEFLSI